MSCSSGPNIVTNGLVFEYDMGNTQKSWKGKPTTNTANQSLSVWNGLTGTYISTDFDGWMKYSLSGTWNNGTYPYSMGITSSSNFLGAIPYSAQLQIKLSCPQKFGGWGGINYVNDPNMVNGGTYTMIDNGSYQTWKREGFIYSSGYAGTGGTSQMGYMYTMPIANGTTFNSSTDFVWIRNIQIEQNSFCTPFVNGSRSTTTALIDLTGNNTITANSLTYNSDGTFGFNGGNYISVGNMGSNYNNFTVEVWFKPNSVSNYQNPIDCSFGTGNVGPRLEMNSSGTLGWVTGSSMNTYQGTQVVASGLTQGAIHCTVITKSGSTNTAYYQGNYVSSNTESYAHPGTFSNVIIGKGFSESGERWLNGTIYLVKIYNRALTSAEIKQNFNALRGRFGI